MYKMYINTNRNYTDLCICMYVCFHFKVYGEKFRGVVCLVHLIFSIFIFFLNLAQYCIEKFIFCHFGYE